MSNSLTKIVEACQYLLLNYSGAQDCRNYLNNRVNEVSQSLFQFGYFPNIENIKVLTSLVGEDCLIDNSLIFNKEIEDSLYPRKLTFSFFEEYPLIMPYKDVYGEVVALVGRSLLSDKERKTSKYKNTTFAKSKHVFGLYENKKSILDKGCVFVVEGQFDTIKAVECGFTNIVSLGSASMSSYQFSIINRYTNNICLLLDNDDAGEKGRKRIIEKFGDFANINNFYLPEPYKDIDEYLMENSYEDLTFSVRV